MLTSWPKNELDVTLVAHTDANVTLQDVNFMHENYWLIVLETKHLGVCYNSLLNNLLHPKSPEAWWPELIVQCDEVFFYANDLTILPKDRQQLKTRQS